MGRKYCKECAEKIKNEVVMSDDFKIVTCIDCGENFKIDKKDTRTCRCEECQKGYIRAYDRERKRRMKNSVDQPDS